MAAYLPWGDVRLLHPCLTHNAIALEVGREGCATAELESPQQRGCHVPNAAVHPLHELHKLGLPLNRGVGYLRRVRSGRENVRKRRMEARRARNFSREDEKPTVNYFTPRVPSPPSLHNKGS